MTTAHPGRLTARRVRLRVEGIVQGVGFRPHVFRLATSLHLRGFVRNAATHVEAELEGDALAVGEFLQRLEPEAPPLSVIERVVVEDAAPTGATEFVIVPSTGAETSSRSIAPDAPTCARCLAELLDPANRRFRYPFINCTDCGPRFTVVTGIPYDRRYTTMSAFVMCTSCQAEYDDPSDRRFHAQPNACADCGPRVELLHTGGTRADTPAGFDPIAAAAAALRDGRILAIKGLGGYHLACRADAPRAVSELRHRKHREARPFALMVRDLDAARRLVHIDAATARLLDEHPRPIVLCGRREDAGVANDVAPGVDELGIMLPYTPLHHLLLADADVPLVMTSGNISDEPTIYRDDDALARLAGVADLLLVHNRPIATRTDDALVRRVATSHGARTQMLRRSRGYVPAAIALPFDAPPLLACGAELKNTFCLAAGRHAWPSHHIGDLRNVETLESFVEGVAHLQQLLEIQPTLVAHDLHPDYLSTRHALGCGDVTLVAVQHHHAHFAACLAEHAVRDPAIGVIYDGAGWGSDGTVWGGELLVGDIAASRRAGHLRTVRLPGGDRAVHEPWRMACSWLADAHDARPAIPDALRGDVDARRWDAIAALSRQAVPMSPRTSSMGRLLDAAAALAGFGGTVQYEGQAAIEFESASSAACRGAYRIEVCRAEDGAVIFDPREMFLALRRDADAGHARSALSARVHSAVVTATVEAVETIADETGLRAVALGGGVFQNRRLLAGIRQRLVDAGFRVLVPEALPPNDGAISYGQAAVAAARTPATQSGQISS